MAPSLRNRTYTNPFADPDANKSLPSLPQPKILPATPPLPSSLQVGNSPGQGQDHRPHFLSKNSTPSVKDLARVFEKDQLNSKNPFQTPPVPPLPFDIPLDAKVRTRGVKRRSQSCSVVDTKGHQRLVSMGLDTDRTMDFDCTADTSAGPGPDIGPAYGFYGGERPSAEVVYGNGYGQIVEPDPDLDIGSYVEPGGDAGIQEDTSLHSDLSAAVHHKQGYESAGSWRFREAENHSGRSDSTKVGSSNTGEEREIKPNNSGNTLISSQGINVENGIHVETYTNPFLDEDEEQYMTARIRSPTATTYGSGNESAGSGREIPISFSQMLNGEGDTRVNRMSIRAEQPLPPPPRNPARNPPRQPLFKTPLPVRTRSVGLSLDVNPVPSSPQYSPAESNVIRPARKADMALEAERAKMREPHMRAAYLQPSPNMLRLAAEIVRSNGLPIDSGSRAVLGHIPFWVLICILQASLLSIAAAVAVILRDENTSSEDIALGTGTVFWLVISIVIFAISGVAVLFVWARKMGYFSSLGKRLGMEEVGLLDRAIKNDITKRGNGEFDVEANRGNVLSPWPRLYPMPQSQSSLATVETPSLEWQALYPTPEQSMNRINAARYHHEQTPSRPHPRAQDLMNGGTSLQRFNQQSPIQPLQPQQVHLKGAINLPFNSSSPPQTPNPAYYFANHSAPDHIHHQTEQRQGPDFAAANVRCEAWSPLENLQRELNDPVIHNAPEHQRHTIIASKRVQSEERSKNLRQSMDRRPSTKLKRVQTLDSSEEEPSYQTTILEDEGERAGRTSTRYPKMLILQKEMEKVREQGKEGALTRSYEMNDIAANGQSKDDSKFDQSGLELDELNSTSGKTSSSTLTGSLLNGVGMNGHAKAKKVFAAMKDHFTEQHGRSLGSVIKEKKAKKKEEQSKVFEQKRVNAEQDIFVIGEE
ncbi:hypothetical protein EG329_006338 [Mollisiaceae sp. DMI_Dod_QoI]|nr:hypothetical protein EG329_006338 [Helotiales sp. DMI_Dod_QoI]